MTHLLPYSIPSPSDGVIDLGPLPLHLYGLMIALGVVAAVWVGEREAVRLGQSRQAFTSAATWGVVAGIIGSRLYHVATSWENFQNNLGDIPKMWQGGLGVPGGLFAGVVVGLWRARRLGASVSTIATAAAPTIPLAQAIGRWGNWWNQELYGRPTDLPWALEIDPKYRPAESPNIATYHPTFLYESLYNLALCGALLWIGRHVRLKPGRLLAVWVAGYAFGRFWIEGLRIDPAKAGGGLRLNQWTAIIAFVLAVGFMVVFGLRDRTPEPAIDDSIDDTIEPILDGIDP